MTMTTTTLFKVIQSELIKSGVNEIVKPDESKYFKPDLDFLWFNDDVQFTTKILKFDEDVSKIVDNLFSGLSLKNKEHDHHFKKSFINRFVNRQINRQTVEAFKMELVSTFLNHEEYLNSIYENMEKYITQTSVNNQKNKQLTDDISTSDNRSAFADLPQSSTNLDVDNTVLNYASDNTISRNRQKNKQETDGEVTGENKKFQIDELVKAGSLLNNLFDEFDRKCFLQIW